MSEFGWTSDVSDDEDGEEQPGSMTETGTDEAEEPNDVPAWEATDDVDELKQMWLDADGDERDEIEGRLNDMGKVAPKHEEKDEQATLDDATADTASEPADEDAGDDTTQTLPDDDEPAETPTAAADDEPPADPFANIGGDSVNLQEARDMDRRKRVMVWGPPGVGKTHNAYTADPPLAIIDTEAKAHDLATRFDLDPAEVRIWQPSSFPEAQNHLDQALNWLQAWLDERDRRGTVIVDSMSEVWEMAKSHYIHEYYIEPDVTGKYEKESDVDLKSSMQSNDPDWPRIKEYHNDGFRAKMVDSPFHFLWTQMAVEDYEEKLGKSLQQAPDKPHGERDNKYKVNYILHIREDSDGVPIGDLEKSGTTQHTFSGLEWPTQDKLFDVLADIEAAETSDDDVPPGEVTDHDVSLIKGKPSRLRGVEDDDS